MGKRPTSEENAEMLQSGASDVEGTLTFSVLSSSSGPHGNVPQVDYLNVNDDTQQSRDHRVEHQMAEITREEIDAKLEASEARLEGRLASIDGKLDRLFDRVEVSVEQSRQAQAAAENAKTSASNTKWNILFTAIGTVTVLLAFWAIWMQGMEMIGTLVSAAPEVPNPPAE